MSVAELEAHEVAREGATGGLWRDAFRRLVKNPAAILGATYFAIRSRVVAFGSSSDVHGFDIHSFVPTLM